MRTTVRGGVAAALSFALLDAPTGPVHAEPPRRVVSMNLCTDQLAMLLAAPGQLHSVSYLASRADTSVLAAEARAFVPNHGLAEEIFLMQPDLIIAGTFTTRATVEMLKRLGFPVEEFAPANSFADIRSNILRMGEVLGRQAAARALIGGFDRELATLTEEAGQGQAGRKPVRPIAALYYANSYTSGNNTLAAEVVDHAQLDNLGSGLGLKGTVTLPLELLVMNGPDLVVTGRRFGREGTQATVALEHPALEAVASRTTSAVVTDKYWVCGLPFTLHAVRRLVEAARSLDLRPIAPPALATTSFAPANLDEGARRQ
ncbi:MAG: ABC transporter substrate-binding protein [Rhizobiales bacterium]|nr:ABC transporter substrate-binding protein [Hyphomicrobiales bacterium]